MSVSASRTSPFYVGTSLDITCTVTLEDSVNNNETVDIHWSGIEHVHYQTTTIQTKTSDYRYTGYLTISPLAIGDSGMFTCTGTVSGENQFSNSSNDIAIDVEGKLQVELSFVIYFISQLRSPTANDNGVQYY